MPVPPVLLLTLAISTAHPQAAMWTLKNERAEDFYFRFSTALQAARSVDDIAALLSSDLAHDFRVIGGTDKMTVLETMKRAESGISGVKIVKETPRPGGTELSLEAIGTDGRVVTRTAALAKDQGDWKVVKIEPWHPSGGGARLPADKSGAAAGPPDTVLRGRCGS